MIMLKKIKINQYDMNINIIDTRLKKNYDTINKITKEVFTKKELFYNWFVLYFCVGLFKVNS